MELNSKNIKRLLLLSLGVALIFCVVMNFGATLSVINKVFSFFSPVIAATCIAFVLNVLLTALETKVFKFMDKSHKKIVLKLKRPVCLALTYLIAFGIISLLILVIIPDIIDTISYLVDRLPVLVVDLRNWIEGAQKVENLVAVIRFSLLSFTFEARYGIILYKYKYILILRFICMIV